MNQINLENMWAIMRENRFEIIDDISSDYMCVICNNILMNACSAHCGCRFCLDCIRGYLNGEKRKFPGQSTFCNLDLIDMDKYIQINPLINKMIPKLKVKCPNIDCQSQEELNMIGDHLRICENRPQACSYSVVGCEEVKLGSHQVRNHLSTEIHSHSNLLMYWIRNSQNETNSLRGDVDKLRGDYDKMREKMRIDGERSDKIIGYLQKRVIENVTEIENLGDEMVALKNSNRFLKEELKTVKEKKEEHISQLKTQVENQRKEIEKFKQTLEMKETRCNEIRHEAKRDQMKLDEIYKDNTTVKAELMGINQSMQTMKIATDDLTDKLIDIQGVIGIANCGNFTWKIDNLLEILQNHTKEFIYSNSFLSHPGGYQMCIAMQSYYNDLWFSFCIMRGLFDDLQRWPFDRDVELSFMNQETCHPHKTSTIKYSNYPDEIKLQKPKTSKNEPIHFYYISLKEILENPELHQNDQILLKCCVKPTEDQKPLKIRK